MTVVMVMMVVVMVMMVVMMVVVMMVVVVVVMTALHAHHTPGARLTQLRCPEESGLTQTGAPGSGQG